MWKLSDWRGLRRYGWLLLIMLTAVFLRLVQISQLPPGLTHDEADHGLTAWGILQGQHAIYFSVGHGREPLYDYATAVIMRFIGPTYLAGRITAVFFSIATIAGLYAWGSNAFNKRVGIMAAAGLSVSFWGVMAARQSLRSITLPALFLLALIFYWKGQGKGQGARDAIHYPLSTIRSFIAGLFLGLTFYTYIPARIMWLLFPMMLIYAGVMDREKWGQMWRGTAVMLFVAFVISLPLFLFLSNHPELEIRIQELSDPLTRLKAGDFSLLWQNTVNSLRLFTIKGDSTWRYNLPERPFLQPVMGFLFYGGIGVAIWQAVKKRGQQGLAAFAALSWLLLGMAPVFVTGPDLSMTQAIGIQPVLYLFPALALNEIAKRFRNYTSPPPNPTQRGEGLGTLSQRDRVKDKGQRTFFVFVLLLFSGTAVTTVRDYFIEWANAPEVRVQYESTMATAMAYLNEQDVQDVAISTITPGEFHTPALAKMMLTNEAVVIHWFDGRSSLLLPKAEESVVILSQFAGLNPALMPYFETAVLSTTLPLRETDKDRPLEVYHWQRTATLADWQTRFTPTASDVRVGDALHFLGVDLQTPQAMPGEVIRVATLWQIDQPLFMETRLFTHLLTADGNFVAQQDLLAVPPESWQAGDLFIQYHEFMIPMETAVGDYTLSIGGYTCPETCEKGIRFPIFIDGEPIGDTLTVQSITIK